MKKVEMIKVIQQKEADLWLQLKKDENIFGADHVIVSKSRGEWCTTHKLMIELEIKSNNLLPEFEQAIKLICEKVEKESVN